MLSLSEYIQQRVSEDAINDRDRSKRMENIKICTNANCNCKVNTCVER